MKEVWYVAGEDTDGHMPTLFDTKLAAEAYARVLFSEESESKRYARIYCRPVLSLSDVNGG